MEENSKSNIYQSDDETYYGVGSFIWEVIKVFFWALLIIMPIRVFLFQPFFVQGASMDPNFKDGDYLIVNELGYKKTQLEAKGINFLTVDPFRELEREDVVVFRYPRNPQQFFVKRIIGLPGEEVRIENGKVKVINEKNPQGFFIDEAYLPKNIETSPPLIKKLSEEEYFVMGDNRPFSHDSRAWGPLNKDKVIGKVIFRAWPFNEIEIF